MYFEILDYSKELNFNFDETNYLIWGGMPARFEFKGNEHAIKDYLSSLENTIIYNDLITRFNIKKEVAFKNIVNFVLSNNSRILSARSIYRYIKRDYVDITLPSVVNYIDYLKKAYLIDEIKQFSTSKKRDLLFNAKLYNCDVAFNSMRVENKRFDLDHNLENIVYNELLYRGYQLRVFINSNNKEIDFLATKNGKNYLIQVAHCIIDDKAYEREMSAFDNVDNSYKKIIISLDNADFSTSQVVHINFSKFIKAEDLLSIGNL